MPEKTIKILYIITKSVWAGAGKYVYDLATALPQTRFRSMVAAGGNGELAKKIKEAGIPYFEIKHFQRDISIFKEIFAYFEILKLLFKIRPDIIHVNSSKAGGIVGVACWDYKFLTFNFKLKTIFTAHGWAFHESRPKWQIWLIRLVTKITCFCYSRIICVSEYDYQSAIKNKIAPAKKLIAIHNGIKPEEYNFSERTGKEFTVGTIGEAVKNKGHEYLREAEKNFPGIKFNIISNMPDAARYLKNFDIFVLPSLKEGLPYVLLEAGLAEIPIIATNVGGVPEIIENEKTGLLINPANPDEITKAIKKLINNPGLAKTLAQNAHQKILQEFSFEKMLQRTLATYEDKTTSEKDTHS
jgi:glycosyltransferase involved in cell wall biosynthesis